MANRLVVPPVVEVTALARPEILIFARPDPPRRTFNPQPPSPETPKERSTPRR